MIQYAIANIPGAVPYTSTLALTNATLPYALRFADMGWREACKKDPGLADGVNMVDGKIHSRPYPKHSISPTPPGALIMEDVSL